MKAEDIMNAIKHPVPWIAAAPRAIAVVLVDKAWPDACAAEIRFAAKGALRSRGYAGKTHVGVMV